MEGGRRALQVFCIGTFETKRQELIFLSDCVQSNLTAFSKGSSLKVEVTILDVSCSTRKYKIRPPENVGFVTKDFLLYRFLGTEGRLSFKHPSDRGEANCNPKQGTNKLFENSPRRWHPCWSYRNWWQWWNFFDRTSIEISTSWSS
ncbi:hypothetical protein KSP39_PZI010823 [Platanthera zijinensis]|uniref:Uncharacterized protein n=1 Tax=Platanthera zijinensis TaxID=2320716 RepID=A0AAP0BGR5_9ASPA